MKSAWRLLYNRSLQRRRRGDDDDDDEEGSGGGGSRTRRRERDGREREKSMARETNCATANFQQR